MELTLKPVKHGRWTRWQCEKQPGSCCCCNLRTKAVWHPTVALHKIQKTPAIWEARRVSGLNMYTHTPKTVFELCLPLTTTRMLWKPSTIFFLASLSKSSHMGIKQIKWSPTNPREALPTQIPACQDLCKEPDGWQREKWNIGQKRLVARPGNNYGKAILDMSIELQCLGVLQCLVCGWNGLGQEQGTPDWPHW